MRHTTADGSMQMLRTLLILMGVFFVMVILSGSLGSWLSVYFVPESRECYLLQSAVQAVVGFVATAVITSRLCSTDPKGFLGMRLNPGWRPFVGVVVMYLLCMPFLNQLIYWNAGMKLPEAFAGVERYMREMEELNGKISEIILSSDSIGGMISGVLIIGVLTGFAEEILFRGTLQNALCRNSKIRVWGVWIAAAIFSAVHLQFFGFFPRLLLGAFFGYLLYSTGSLWPGVFAHALNNSIVVVSMWLQHRDPTFPDMGMIGVSETGFPLLATVSLVATVMFIIYGYGYFFKKSKSSWQ